MGYVIGIYSAKGGVGKSLIATNLGVAVGVGQKHSTALIDLSPGLGTADVLLDLEPERSWADLLPVMDELTDKHLRLAVTEYRPGMDLLACPPGLLEDERLDREDIASLLGVFREKYEVIFLDTASGWGSVNRAAYLFADLRLMVLTPDVPSLRTTRRYLNSIPEKEITTGLVINQNSPGAAVEPQEIADHLDLKVFSVLPMDPNGVWSNVSYGQPCVLRKNSRLGKSFRRMAKKVLKCVDR